MGRLHRPTCLAALALLLTVPFLLPHHYNPIPTFFQEWTAALLSLVALTWLLRPAPDGRVEFPEIGLLPLGLLALALLQLVLPSGAIPERVLMLALYLIWASLMAVLGRRLANDLGHTALADLLAAALLAGALIEGLTGALQASGIGRLPWIFVGPAGGLRGNVGQPNNFADYLWLGVASCIYLRCRDRLSSPFAAAALAVLVPLSLLSGSRSVWFHAGALALLGQTWMGRHPDAAHRRLRTWAWTALALAVLSQGLLEAIPDLRIATAGGRLSASGAYDPVRTALWSVAWTTFREHPLLGAGFGQYTREFLDHVLELMPRWLPGLPEHAHNLILNLMAELGAGAALLTIGLGLRWALDLWRREADAALWWVAATATIVGSHALLEYPLWYGFFLAPAALVAGAISRGRPLDLGLRVPWLVGGIAVLGSIALLTLRADYALLEDTANGRLPPETSPGAALTRVAGQPLLRPYVDLAAASLMDDGPKDLEAKRQTCGRALRFSASREIVFKCAYIQLLDGDPDGAQILLQRAVAAYPEYAAKVLARWRERAPQEPLLALLVQRFPPIFASKAPEISAGGFPPALPARH